nr:uncharacterized protein LOC129159237 [Nothobranchius furzeri]
MSTAIKVAIALFLLPSWNHVVMYSHICCVPADVIKHCVASPTYCGSFVRDALTIRVTLHMKAKKVPNSRYERRRRRVGPGCRHQLVCQEQDGVSLLLPENRRAKDLGRKLVFFWRPLRCFCFNHTRRVSVEERTIEALKNGTQAVISDGEIKTLYKDLCSGRVKSGLMYLWHNPGVSLKLKQRLKPLMFHFADAQVDELTERIGSCSGIDKLIKKREFQFLDLVFDVLVPEVQRSLQQ